MISYLPHLESAYNRKTFQRKIEYIKYNIAPYLSSEKKSRTFLEIGPGLGEFVAFSNELDGSAIDIVDNDKGVLQYVSKKFKVSKSFQTEDLALIDRKLGKYDGVIGIQVLEHIPPTQYKNFLKILLDHTQSGGKIIFVVPNANNPLSMAERYGDLQHFNAFTTRSLQDLVSLVDVSNLDISVVGYRIPPTDMLNIIRIILQKILHVFLLAILLINGGVFFTVMTPNSMLVITKK